MEFQASASKAKPKHITNHTLLIFSNICDESTLNGENKTGFATCFINQKKPMAYMFDTPIYLPLKKNGLLEFTVRIKDRNDSEASFLQ